MTQISVQNPSGNSNLALESIFGVMTVNEGGDVVVLVGNKASC
jgi:hypothetical protein